MTVKKIIQQASNRLNQAGFSRPNLEAEIILGFVLKKSREFLLARPEKEITPALAKKFRQLVSRRLAGEPFAYLTGQKEFFGLKFQVNEKVLIPRPETEQLAEELLNRLNQSGPAEPTIVDLGTGSGCLAIVAKLFQPTARVIGLDISEPALKLAKKNARNHRVKISFLKSDLLKKISKIKIDFLVANLPYLKTGQIKDGLVKFEPAIALDGGPDGSKLYQKLFKEITKLTEPPQTALLEISPEILKKIKAEAKKCFPNEKISIKKDLAGQSRIMIIDF